MTCLLYSSSSRADINRSCQHMLSSKCTCSLTAIPTTRMSLNVEHKFRVCILSRRLPSLHAQDAHTFLMQCHLHCRCWGMPPGWTTPSPSAPWTHIKARSSRSMPGSCSLCTAVGRLTTRWANLWLLDGTSVHHQGAPCHTSACIVCEIVIVAGFLWPLLLPWFVGRLTIRWAHVHLVTCIFVASQDLPHSCLHCMNECKGI